MKIKINNNNSTITDSTLSGFLQENGLILWKVTVDGNFVGSSDDKTFFSAEIEEFEWNITKTEDFALKSISIPDGAKFSDYMLVPGKGSSLYVDEHSFLDVPQLSFYYHHNELFMKLSGLSYPTLSIVYELNLDCKIEFLGINLGKLTQEKAKALLSFDINGLVFYQEEKILYLVPPYE